MIRRDLHEENRISWNLATQAHNSHKRKQAQFFKNGGSTLFPEELELLGPINGKKLVHLQCNAGQDTLSLAALGANVTGVDISDKAIEFARQLSLDSGIPANFIQADIYDWFEKRSPNDDPFEIVFVSYGALIWLSDIKAWAKGVAKVLSSAGSLIIMEFHPYSLIFKDDWTLGYPYFAEGNVLRWSDGVGDYVAETPALAPSGYKPGIENFENPFPANEFQWALSEIVTAVLEAGLSLRTLREYPFANGARLFEGMQEEVAGRFYPPANIPSLPLMFGLAASKDSS